MSKAFSALKTILRKLVKVFNNLIWLVNNLFRTAEVLCLTYDRLLTEKYQVQADKCLPALHMIVETTFLQGKYLLKLDLESRI